MSNEKERGRLGDIMMREFAEYATSLNLAGHDWAAAWSMGTWPVSSDLWWRQGRFSLARECAAAVGHRFTDAEITQFYRERLAYLAAFPDGAPVLPDE
ncbi:hypothetical protein [Streptomyces chrestomyceticus]|uniref:hypothetical protein n=1 Tax=Streptomyces chrestomyceticus TaxID=68185 RepID=UPI0033F37BE5